MLLPTLFPAAFEGKPLAVIPFEDARGGPTFTVRFGDRPVTLSLDTGADDSYIALPEEGPNPGPKTWETRFSPTFSAPVPFVPWVTTLVGKGGRLSNRDTDGGLGAEWAARYVLDLDYGRKRLTIWPRSASLAAVITSRTARPRTIPLRRLDDGTFTLRMQIDGVPCTTIFDTGARSLVIAPGMQARLGLRSASEIDTAMYGGVQRLKIVWPRRITLGERFVLPPLMTRVLPEAYLPEGTDALYGGDLLKPRTILDLGHHRLVHVDEGERRYDLDEPLVAKTGTVAIALEDGRRFVRKIGETCELPAGAKVAAIVEGVGARMGPEERTASGTIRVRILRADRPKE